MGDKMRAFAQMLRKDKELQKIVLQEMQVLASIDTLRLFEDPDTNHDVARVLKEVGERLVRAENQRLIDNFRILCLSVAIDAEWDDGGGEDLEVDLFSISQKAVEVSTQAPNVAIARMTGSYVARMAGKRASESQRGSNRIEIIQSRMGYIQRGSITMEICAKGEGDNFPELRKGDEIFLVRNDERVPVEAKRVAEYNDISKLLEGEDVKLKKWLPGMELSDIQTVAERMFKGVASRGKKLVVIEFEKVN